MNVFGFLYGQRRPNENEEDYKSFIDGLLPDTRLLIQPKINGCAIAIK